MKKLGTLLAVAFLLTSFGFAQANPLYPNNMGGRFMASEYGKWAVHNLNSTASGAASMTLDNCFISVGTGNKKVFPIALNVPVTIIDGTLTETALAVTAVTTPAAASGPSAGPNPFNCSFTATFANAHNSGVTIVSGDGGFEEAINDAENAGGGIVTLDPSFGSTAVTSLVVYGNILIEDLRAPQVQWWGATQGASTVLGTPIPLVAQAACDSTHYFCSDATVAGSASWGGAVYGCIAYVDIMGNEGPCSTTANFTSVASKAIDIGFVGTGPAASTGAVGYTIYLSLSGGSYAFAYQIPITSSVCTLTKLETITPACAVANTTYGQAGSNAQFTGYPVNTSPLALQSGTTSSTTDYVGNTNARTTYIWAPSSHIAGSYIQGSSLPFPTAAAAASTVPEVIGTIAVPNGFMNYVGKTIEVCGYATQAAAGSTSTITTMEVFWDAPGSNAAGVPVLIGTIPMTNTLVTAKTDQYYFCMDFMTTVSGAGATAGSIQQTGGFFTEQYTSSSVATVPVTVLAQGPAAVASLNLAGTAGFTTRLQLVYLHSTGTDANGLVLQNATVKVLN